MRVVVTVLTIWLLLLTVGLRQLTLDALETARLQEKINADLRGRVGRLELE